MMKIQSLLLAAAAMSLAASVPAHAFVCPPAPPAVGLQCDGLDPSTYDSAQKEIVARAEVYVKASASRPKAPNGALDEKAMKKATTPLGQSMQAALIEMLKDLRERARAWSWAPANQTRDRRIHQSCMFRLLYAVDQDLMSLSTYVMELDEREAKAAAPVANKTEAEVRAAIYAPELKVIEGLLAEMTASKSVLEQNTAKILLGDRKLWKIILKKGGAKGQYKQGVLSINPTAVFHKPTLRAVLVHEIGHYVTEVGGYRDEYTDEFHGYWREYTITVGRAKTPAEVAARSAEIHEVLRCLYPNLQPSNFAAPHWPFLDNELPRAKLRKLATPIEPPGGKARLKGDDLTAHIATLTRADKQWAIATLTQNDATWRLLNDALADELLTRLGGAPRPKANPYDAILDKAEGIVAGPK